MVNDESIEELHILEEPTELGYTKQHGLKINSFGHSILVELYQK